MKSNTAKPKTKRNSLPTVPLWLGGDLAVPLDLDVSHAAACLDPRIRHAGYRQEETP